MSRQFTKQAVVDLSAAQKFHHSVTQMQSLKLRVWVIFIFRHAHQIISGHSVKLCQCRNRKWADVFVVIALIFPQCRLRQAGLFCQLFQRQVLIHHPQVFEPFRDRQFCVHQSTSLPTVFVFHYSTFPRAWKYAVFMCFSCVLDIREQPSFFGKLVLVRRHRTLKNE